MGQWSFVVGPAAGGLDLELADAHNRVFTARLTGQSEASCQIDGTSPQAASVEEISTDLHVFWRDGGSAERLYRGRAGTGGDSLDENSHTVDITSLDYRALLKRRRLYTTSTLTYTSLDQAEVARQLIAQTQSRTAGDLGITMGIGNPTGVTVTRTYSAGDAVGDKIEELAETTTGFDWEITPVSDSGLVLNVWYPQRGTDNAVVLEYGGLVSKVRRDVNSADYANAIRETGADALVAQEREATDLATRPEGRWDGVYGDTTIADQNALNARADWQLAQAEVITPVYTLTLAPGAWEGPSHIWLGDPVHVVVFSGRLQVDTVQRVYEMRFTIGDDGTETVEITTGGPRLDYRKRPADTLRRITNLERR